jgi:hypothetical protein|tara:strand:- start:410 stop:583 length:174 start_codon:yes stop_codon:yes gene_type:complete
MFEGGHEKFIVFLFAVFFLPIAKKIYVEKSSFFKEEQNLGVGCKRTTQWWVTSTCGN